MGEKDMLSKDARETNYFIIIYFSEGETRKKR